MKAADSNMDNNRKLLNVRDVLIIVLLLGAASGMYLFRGSSDKASYAVITLDGTAADKIPLDVNGRYTYPQMPGMIFTVSDGAVSVMESSCSDKVCVRTGEISHMGEAIICVPNKVAVTVEGGKDDLDVVLR